MAVFRYVCTMVQKKITSHDVAKKVGVSRATVSLVLNKSTKVKPSEQTRKHVLRVAEELGYKPNAAARMLVSGYTETIGLVIPDETILPHDGFISQFILGMGQVARDSGYHILIEGVGTEPLVDPYANLVATRRIDGMIIISPRENDPYLVDTIESGFPVVLAGHTGHAKEYSVAADVGESIRHIVDHLVGLGHRQFGSVPFSNEYYAATSERLSAIRSALKRHNISLPDEHVMCGNFTAESGFRATKRLIEQSSHITAILCGNDTVALGAMSAIQSAGLSVPEDISIVGVDDLPFSEMLSPPLSTVRLDGQQIGSIAVQTLIQLMRNEVPSKRTVLLPSKPIIRSSCGALKAHSD